MTPPRIRLTPELLRLLAQHRVRTAQVGDRWQVDDVLEVHYDAIIEPYCLIGAGRVLPAVFMAFSFTNSPCGISMRVGRYVSIADGVQVMGNPHPTSWVSTSPFCYHSHPRRPFAEYYQDRGLQEPPRLDFDHGTRQVIVGHDVWIGAEAMLKRGITIGEGAVIGARSVVTRDVLPYAIVGGSPARIIRHRLPEPLAERMRALRWWRFTPDQLRMFDLQDPERFVGEMEDRIAAGLVPHKLLPLTFEKIAAAGERL